MKISLKAILVSAISYFIFVTIISWFIIRVFDGLVTRFFIIDVITIGAIFICGIIAGYIAQKRGLIHGFISGLLIVVIPISILIAYWVYWRLILKATWTGNAVDIKNFVVTVTLLLFISGGVAMMGGRLGEIMYKKSTLQRS